MPTKTPTTTPAGNILLHDDHNLEEAHLEVIDSALKDAGSATFVAILVPLPGSVPSLPSLLYGPACGDDPVPEAHVWYFRRGERKGPSRMVARPPRMVRRMVIVAARDADGGGWRVFTAYGSQVLAPREWWDRSMNEEEAHEAFLFWKDHALASE